jgi:hypothetical protein
MSACFLSQTTIFQPHEAVPQAGDRRQDVAPQRCPGCVALAGKFRDSACGVFGGPFPMLGQQQGGCLPDVDLFHPDQPAPPGAFLASDQMAYAGQRMEHAIGMTRRSVTDKCRSQRINRSG